MTPFGIVLESFKLDKLTKKWVARCLFLLVYLVNASVLFFQPGNADFSSIIQWQEQLKDLPPTALMLPPIPSTLLGNLIYIACVVAMIYFDALISQLYARIMIGDASGQKTVASFVSYLKRFPFVFLFYFCVFIAVMFLNLFLSIFSIFSAFFFLAIIGLVMLFFFVPQLMIYEKSGIIQAFIKNNSLIRGKRLFVFICLLLLHAIYSIPKFLTVVFLWDYPQASALLDALFATVLCLSFGRMNGIIYRLICTKSSSNESEKNPIENR